MVKSVIDGKVFSNKIAFVAKVDIKSFTFLQVDRVNQSCRLNDDANLLLRLLCICIEKCILHLEKVRIYRLGGGWTHGESIR